MSARTRPATTTPSPGRASLGVGDTELLIKKILNQCRSATQLSWLSCSCHTGALSQARLRARSSDAHFRCRSGLARLVSGRAV